MGAHIRHNAAARSRAPLHTASNPVERRGLLSPTQAASIAVLVALLLLVIIVGATLFGVLAETAAALTAFLGVCAAFMVLCTAVVNRQTAHLQLERTMLELERPTGTDGPAAAPGSDVNRLRPATTSTGEQGPAGGRAAQPARYGGV